MDPLMHIYNWWNGVPKIKATLKKDENPLRIGILSAANINYAAVIDPVQTHPGAIVTGLAARDRSRAQAQIDKYGISSTCKAYGSYDELLAEPSIQAVYVPLPNGLHGEWAIKAMEAGKHVLIEKPITSNAEEARRVRETASRTNKVALESFHWRFHPAAHYVKSLVESGEYGRPSSILARLILPPGFVRKDDIRLNYGLAGGACMDLTYVFSASTYFASSDISKCEFKILEATPRLDKRDEKVDQAMKSKFVIKRESEPAVNCEIECDLSPPPLFGYIPRYWAFTGLVSIELEKAKVDFTQFIMPSFGHSITIIEKTTGKKHIEKRFVDGSQWSTRGQPWWTTYRYQLEAFVDMIKAKEAGTQYAGPRMGLDESEKVMELIDAVYDKADMPRRGLKE